MSVALTLGSCAAVGFLLMDGFEAMILPRRVTRRFRLTRFFYLTTWKLWSTLARWIGAGKSRQTFLSVFGPLSMLGLFATWVAGLIATFALLHWSLGTALRVPDGPAGPADLGTCAYLSGVTFFTLGFGDVTPVGPLGRVLAVVEAGVGFGFLAIIIGYLPVLYQAFSHREVTISLLDARAGSPPSAGQLLIRMTRAGSLATLDRFLADWEIWAAELLESHLSFPVLSFYRSQHDNQSWLACLTMILDACSLVIAETQTCNPYQAQLTFAMARHTAVDLALVLNTPPCPSEADRYPDERRRDLRASLTESGLPLRIEGDLDGKLAELRGMYEPFLNGLSRRLMLPLPAIFPEGDAVDNWQTSAWTRRIAGLDRLAPAGPRDDHFD